MSSLEIKQNNNENNNEYNVIINTGILLDRNNIHNDENNYIQTIGSDDDNNNNIVIKIIKNGDNSFNIAYNYNNYNNTNNINKIFINYIYLIFDNKKLVINIEKEFEIEKEFGIEIKIKFIKTIEKENRELRDEHTNQMYKKIFENEKWSIENMIMKNNQTTLLETKNLDSFFDDKYFYFIVGGNCSSSNNDYYYHNVGDGNCLFNAFAQIFIPADRDTKYYDEKVPNIATNLRKFVATIYEHSLNNENIREKYNIKLDKKFTIDEKKNNEIVQKEYKLEEYTNYIKEDKAYSADDDLTLLSIFFNFNCNIIQYQDTLTNTPTNTPVVNQQLNLKLAQDKKNFSEMYPFESQDKIIIIKYPFIFCNVSRDHWELKKHNCYFNYLTKVNQSVKDFNSLFDDENKEKPSNDETQEIANINDENKKKPSNDETQEIANIIKAIDVFINSGSSSTSITNDYSDEVVSVVGAVDGSNSSGSSSGSSTSTTNDYSDEVVSVVGAVDGSRSTGSGSSTTTTASSSSSSVTSTTFIVPKEKTNLKDFFMKTSYIIKKGDKKYLFAELGSATAPEIAPVDKVIYKNAEITITEFWQNKLIDTEQFGYIIEDGAEKYGVVPDF
uniref:OTU domain-containing protein n=1 Tax=viral metagenome TaxID=1070528 RepID=A0A6C0DD61_9ZZZZ